MAAPTTIAEFLEVARKSKQVDCGRLEAYLDDQRHEPMPAKPRKFAQQLIREGLLTLFQAEQFLQGKYKGFHLGGYRILDRLGAGGAGTVYLAEHEVMRRKVAIKVLPTPFAEDKELLERFHLEARAAALLDHPNVVHVLDYRSEGPLHFIVMEYIEGPNLQQMVNRRGSLPIALACDYIRQAAIGLQHAHEAGLVHRDVKPANLLVASDGLVKVLDLGLARYEPEGADSVTQRFNNRMVLGTADYLAPEQALNLHNVDARADVYSLGATLFTLLAGRPPFHEGSLGQKLMWHQMREPPAVTQFRPDVPAKLAVIVAKMLAKRPEDRFQSALEVIETLTSWADPTPRPEMQLSPTSLLEIRLGPPTGALAMPSSKLAPTRPSVETLSHAKDDTSSIELQERDRSRRSSTVPVLAELPANNLEGLGLRLAIYVSLVALMAGLAGGVIAFLLWGPKVGP
jgi:serine/threonine protein kinase